MMLATLLSMLRANPHRGTLASLSCLLNEALLVDISSFSMPKTHSDLLFDLYGLHSLPQLLAGLLAYVVTMVISLYCPPDRIYEYSGGGWADTSVRVFPERAKG